MICGKDSLNERENVDFEAEDNNVLLSQQNIALCCVVKVLITRRGNIEAFRSLMKSVWCVHQDTRIAVARKNMFLIHFKHTGEKTRITNTGHGLLQSSNYDGFQGQVLDSNK